MARIFIAINPKGAVPALGLDDGQVLTEAAVIQQYIADKVPGTKLAAAAGSDGTLPSPGVAQLHRQRATQGHRQLFTPVMPETTRSCQTGLAAKQFPYLDKALAGRNCLVGDFTVADGYLFTVLNWTNLHKIDLAPYPNMHSDSRNACPRDHGRAGCDEGGRFAEGGVSHAAFFARARSGA